MLAAGFGAPLVLAGCSPPLIVDYRYRFNVVVRVDGEEHEGSSVFRVRFQDNTRGVRLPGGGGTERVTLWAEAPIVDLGPRHGLLFATIYRRVSGVNGGYAAYVFPTVAVDFNRRAFNHGQPGTWEQIREEGFAALREMADLTREYVIPEPLWPTFVRFANLQNPASVQEVTQANIAFFYGADAAIVRVTAQITDERPTRRIDEVLPWLREHRYTLSGDPLRRPDGPIGGQLGVNDLIRWNKSS